AKSLRPGAPRAPPAGAASRRRNAARPADRRAQRAPSPALTSLLRPTALSLIAPRLFPGAAGLGAAIGVDLTGRSMAFNSLSIPAVCREALYDHGAARAIRDCLRQRAG